MTDACAPFVFDPESTFIHLDEGGDAVLMPVDEDFWTKMHSRLDRGRLVSRFRSEDNWESWERHPAGDELILLLSGRMTLLVEKPNGSVARSDLGPGGAVVVPRGCWHTADVHEPCDALFVTPGRDTEHRERERK